MKIFNSMDTEKERERLEFLNNEFHKSEPSYDLAIAAGITEITDVPETPVYSGEAYIQMADGTLWHAYANSPFLLAATIAFEKIGCNRPISTGSKELDSKIGGGFHRGKVSIIRHNCLNWRNFWSEIENKDLSYFCIQEIPTREMYPTIFGLDYIILKDVEYNEELKLFCQEVQNKNVAVIIISKRTPPYVMKQLAHLILEQDRYDLVTVKNCFDSRKICFTYDNKWRVASFIFEERL